MLQIMFNPSWFFNYDIGFDIFSAIVTLLIALYAQKIYKYTNDRKYKFFSISFILIGISFISKSLTNFVIYHPIIISKQIGFLVLNYSAYQVSKTPFIYGVIIYRFLQLTGLMGLFIILSKHKERREILYLLLYLIFVVSVFSGSAYFIFHMTSLLLLSFISHEYYRRYRLSKKTKGKDIFISFILILLSQFMFIFVFLTEEFYVIGEFLQLIGYGILSFIMYKIIIKK